LVSKSAKACPNCGAGDPVKKNDGCFVTLIKGVFGAAVLLVMGVVLIGMLDGYRESPKKTVDVSAQDLDCQLEQRIDDKVKSDTCENNYKKCKDSGSALILNSNLKSNIEVACRFSAEKKSISTVNWGSGSMRNFDMLLIDSGNAKFKEDKISIMDNVSMYQNEFGAMIKKNTFCTYNLKTKEVEEIYIDALPS
jgi:hypothetical protein